MVENLDDLGLFDPGDTLRTLGVIDEQNSPQGGTHEVGAGDEADRPTGLVDRDGRPIVDVLDLIGDLRDEIVARDSERIALDQRVARLGEGDHPARHVAVERRGRRSTVAARARSARIRASGTVAVARHEERDAGR